MNLSKEIDKLLEKARGHGGQEGSSFTIGDERYSLHCDSFGEICLYKYNHTEHSYKFLALGGKETILKKLKENTNG